MQVENLTQSTFFLGRSEYQLDPDETLTVPDSVYNTDNAVAQAIHSLDDLNFVTVTSPPVGYPRELGGEGGGGGGGGVANPQDSNLIFATELYA